MVKLALLSLLNEKGLTVNELIFGCLDFLCKLSQIALQLIILVAECHTRDLKMLHPLSHPLNLYWV